MLQAEIDHCLAHVMTFNFIAMNDLLRTINWYMTSLDPLAAAARVKDALRDGLLIAALPEGAPQGVEGAAVWAAVDKFRAVVGREFTLSSRTYQLAFRADASEIRRERDYDAVPRAEAAGIVRAAAENARLTALVKILSDNIIDLHAPASQFGFVVLRRTIAQAARIVPDGRALTPAQLKAAAPKTHRLILEVRAAEGAPMANLNYKLEGPGGPREGRLDAKGSYSWQEVPRGRFTLSLPDVLKTK